MSERLTTLLGALAALLILVALVVPQPAGEQYSRPTSLEIKENGYAGLVRWLRSADVEVVSLQRRISELGEYHLADQGNVMITTMPYLKPMFDQEYDQLLSWVAQGNTLVVMAALNDTPNWSLISPAATLLEDLEQLTSLKFEGLRDDEEEIIRFGGLADAEPYTITPEPDHPLMQQVLQMRAETDLITSIWQPGEGSNMLYVFGLAQHGVHPVDNLWQILYGDGQLLLSASGGLLTNRLLGEMDNAVWFANVVNRHLLDGGKVIFDDLHQGITDVYDPDAFFSDTRLHLSLLFVFVFWLIYMVGTGGRIHSPARTITVPRQADLVRAIGGFMSRKLTNTEAGRLMIDAWLASLSKHGQIDDRLPPWPQLEAMPLIDQSKLLVVRQTYEQLSAGKAVKLKTLRNDLLELQKALA